MTQFLDELEETANLLFELDYELNPTKYPNNNLIFPFQNQPKKGKQIRVSEQELRQCFIQSLRKMTYSIETPTKEKYSFTGKGERSGSLDLCIYKKQKQKYERKNCIEFKAHNMAKSFFNDLHKLTKEKGDNYYIHLLQNCNNGTLKTNKGSKRKSLLTKLTEDLKKLKKCEINCQSLTIVIICLKPKILFYRTLSQKKIKTNEISLNLDYSITKGNISFNDHKKWKFLIPELSEGE